MEYGLQTTFNEPNGVELLEQVRACGFTMARVDVQHTVDARVRRELIDEVIAAGLYPLVIVQDASQIDDGFQFGFHYELRNEPDGPVGGKVDPAAYAELVPSFIRRCDDVGARPWIGAISNLDHDSLRWLTTVLFEVRVLMPDSTLPPYVGISVHRYPPGRSWTVPHEGFGSRAHEVHALQHIIGPRPWMVSEFGYHTAPQRRARQLPPWFFPWRWTDADVDANVRAEWAFWHQQGAEAAVLYQLRRGRNPSLANDCFGIFRPDTNTWKPHAESVPR